MDQAVIDFLNSLPEGSEATRVSNYTVWMGNREVDIRVYDRGAGVGHTRFSVWADWARPDEEASARGGKTYSLGNAAATLDEALNNVHWWKFQPSND